MFWNDRSWSNSLVFVDKILQNLLSVIWSSMSLSEMDDQVTLDGRDACGWILFISVMLLLGFIFCKTVWM